METNSLINTISYRAEAVIRKVNPVPVGPARYDPYNDPHD
jgi:hypothetical protein